MASFLSFFGNSVAFAHIYSKIYNSPEFRDFTDYLNESTPTEALKQFIRNLICNEVDPIVEKLLTDETNNLIFTNGSLTKESQAKLFLGKILSQIYDENIDMVHGFMHVDKETVIRHFVGTLNDVEHLDRATNGKDVYTLLVNFYATQITNWIKDNFTNQLFDQVNEDSVLNVVCEGLGFFNQVYEYDSNNLNLNLLNDDHNMDDDDDDDDDGDDCEDCENKDGSSSSSLDTTVEINIIDDDSNDKKRKADEIEPTPTPAPTPTTPEPTQNPPTQNRTNDVWTNLPKEITDNYYIYDDYDLMAEIEVILKKPKY